MTTTYVDAVSEQVPASNATIYTAPSLDSAHIMAATVFNESATNETLTINLVQSGGSVSVTNQYLIRTIPAGKALVLHEIIGHVLKSGDYISVIASTANALNLKIAIRQLST